MERNELHSGQEVSFGNHNGTLIGYLFRGSSLVRRLELPLTQNPTTSTETLREWLTTEAAKCNLTVVTTSPGMFGLV